MIREMGHPQTKKIGRFSDVVNNVEEIFHEVVSMKNRLKGINDDMFGPSPKADNIKGESPVSGELSRLEDLILDIKDTLSEMRSDITELESIF